MIEVIFPDGRTETPCALSFAQIQEIVGGMVELVSVWEQGKVIHCCCNEEGLMMGLAPNPKVSNRFSGRINMGPYACGTWVILSGKDLLR